MKHALRQWNIKLLEALVDTGYCQRLHDYSMFTKREKSDIVVVLVYVDDLLITVNSDSLIQETNRVLHQKFKVKYLGELKFFLGIGVLR